jgi:serine/threonine protein kinase
MLKCMQDHPNIIRLYDIYSESKYLFIVMDYCEGG